MPADDQIGEIRTTADHCGWLQNCHLQASVAGFTSSWIASVSLFFPTVVHADIVVGFACTLRMGCDAGVIVITT
jgi:hypothetical protein